MHDALEVTDELARGWGGGVGGRVTGRGYAPACAGLEAQDSYELRVMFSGCAGFFQFTVFFVSPHTPRDMH